MHSDLVANLPIGIRRQAVDRPTNEERPCRPSALKLVGKQAPSAFSHQYRMTDAATHLIATGSPLATMHSARFRSRVTVAHHRSWRRNR